jgi:hypothetical protein
LWTDQAQDERKLKRCGSISDERLLCLIAQSLVLDWSLTKRLDVLTECYALTPSGAIDSATGPQPFFDTGLTFKLTPNLQLDGRAGLGLNRHADQFFTGLGLSLRY